jgi:pimeloyl-ACP methyl ester carboxylesterase
MAPRIRFVRGPRGHRLATAVDGEGPYLVLPAWWVSHVERDLANPRFKAFFQTLAGSFTVVRYDRAGVGLSDRERTEFTLEDEVGDLEAVVDGLGIERASLFAISCGAPPAIALAMRRPALVERLIFFGGYLRGADIGRPGVQQALVALVRASWGLGSRRAVRHLHAWRRCRRGARVRRGPAARRLRRDQRAAARADLRHGRARPGRRRSRASAGDPPSR